MVMFMANAARMRIETNDKKPTVARISSMMDAEGQSTMRRSLWVGLRA